MKRILLSLAVLACSAGAQASGGGHALPYQFKPDTGNQASLQRGARDFMSYCSGCHSMKHLRYSRIGQDLGIPEDLLKKNLMLTSDKVGDQIKSSLSPEQAVQWFGQAPPDLTLETRVRGPEWVYNFLMTFYVDNAKANGVNNLALPGASMPHVLGELQGVQVKKEVHEGEHAEGHAAGSPLELVQPGTLSPAEYQKLVADLVNFMTYAAEPGKNARISTGVKVMLYLFLLLGLTYLLKREFWRDVH